MTVLTQQQKAEIERRLQRRERELYADLHREGAKIGDYPQTAGEVPDPGDASFTALVKDVDQAEIGRDLDELRAVAAALRRIGDEDFGACIDCGRPIAYERLLAEPSAQRCIDCQSRYEREHAGQGRAPTL